MIQARGHRYLVLGVAVGTDVGFEDLDSDWLALHVALEDVARCSVPQGRPHIQLVHGEHRDIQGHMGRRTCRSAGNGQPGKSMHVAQVWDLQNRHLHTRWHVSIRVGFQCLHGLQGKEM